MKRRYKTLLAIVVAGVVLFVFFGLPAGRGVRRLLYSAPPSPSVTARAGIQCALDAFQNSLNADDTAADLAALRRQLALAPRGDAAAELRAFLHSGRDAPTHLSFKLNRDGSLAQAPTLRVIIIDSLMALDTAGAAACAREILASKSSADEWAVSLRAIALNDSSDAGRSFLQAKAREMAFYPPWQENPSAGYLEAFDVFVYTHDTAFVPDLSSFATRTDNPALAHAAFLTLDRLVQEDPGVTLQALLDQPGFLAARSATAAGYFGRADSSDPSQQQLLADYLLSPDRTAPELEAFAGLFPNEIFMVSNNLLTQNPPPSNQEIIARYDAASKLIAQWQADPRFQPLLPQLVQIRNRLNRIRNG